MRTTGRPARRCGSACGGGGWGGQTPGLWRGDKDGVRADRRGGRR